MSNNLKKIHKKMLQELTPSSEERRRVQEVTHELLISLEKISRRLGDIAVRLNGSVAKDTWISGEADIDIFLKIPRRFPRSFLEKDCLEAAREAASDHEIIERYAEHPYIETYINDIRVNIVPCYDVKVGDWLSAADRTPYHTEYMKKKLDDNKRGDVRILKKLLKSTELYGAEIKTNGFSGFLCEILILFYGSFEKLLEAASYWKVNEVVDLERSCNDKEAQKLFNEPLIAIDPIDRMRNAAAAVSEQNFWTFIALAREYLKNPSDKYFHLEPLDITIGDLRELIDNYRSDLILVDIGLIEDIVDVVWGQLYRTERAIKSQLENFGFHFNRIKSWCSDDGYCIILFEVETAILKDFIEHRGPPIAMKEHSDSFLEKYQSKKDSLVGPWIDVDCWKVEKKRGVVDFSTAFKKMIRGDGRLIIPENFYTKLERGYNLYFNGEIIKFCKKNQRLKETVYKFLLGRPLWLEKR